MEQSVSKQSSRGLRERVQARRSRAEKIAAARSVLHREVSGLKASRPESVLPPPRYANPPKSKESKLRSVLRWMGDQPADSRPTPPRAHGARPEYTYMRGTPSRSAPPPAGFGTPYSPPAFEDHLPPSALTRRRHNHKREPVSIPPFLAPVIEFLAAIAVVAALGFFIIAITRDVLKLPELNFGAGVKQAASEHAAAQRAAASVEATAAASAALPDAPVSILLMGSDLRKGDTGYRTDVMLLVTVDARSRRVSALSFPRDLVGKIPGYGDGRINTVMGSGGFESVQGTFEASYGVRPQYYFLINFESFVGLINSIGGIEIDAAQELEDACDLYWSTAGTCRVEPGKREMDGDTALWYVRSRKSSSDFDRLRRAQEVMEGVFMRFMSMKALSRLPELYMQYSADVETNMGITQIVGLLPTAAQVAQDRSLLSRHSIPESVTADWFMPDGARVLLPDYDAVREIVKKATFQEE